jgi:hypothetical protein
MEPAGRTLHLAPRDVIDAARQPELFGEGDQRSACAEQGDRSGWLNDSRRRGARRTFRYEGAIIYRLILTNARPPDVIATGGSLVVKVEDLLARMCSRSHPVEPQAAGIRFRLGFRMPARREQSTRARADGRRPKASEKRTRGTAASSWPSMGNWSRRGVGAGWFCKEW